MAPELPQSDRPGPADYAGSMIVPYPPPPAQVETVPPAPTNRACVYLDGQWEFVARDWQWQPGGWVVARDDCGFARARLFWHTLGPDRSELRYRSGHWIQTAHPTLDCPNAVPCSTVDAPSP